MIKIKVRYIFYVLFALSFISSILTGKGVIGNVFGLAVLTYVLYFTNRIESVYKSDGSLTGNEKAAVIITALFNPLVAQSFYYYCWKKRFPKRAGQANKYGWLVFGAELIIFIIFMVIIWPTISVPK